MKTLKLVLSQKISEQKAGFRLCFFAFLLSCASFLTCYAQILPKDSISVQKISVDSLKPTTTPTISADSSKSKLSIPIQPKKDRSGLDTSVVYYAKDSASYSLKNRLMHLRGNARTSYLTQKLSAEVIDIYFDSSSMKSYGVRDSSGKLLGVPKFNDKSEEFYGEKISYNFKSKKGAISLGETQMDNAFYFGDRIKRMDESTLFIENGCYTTCNHPNPHYYFKSPKMKIVANDRIFADPLYLYVEDVPIFVIPFGIFMENKSGRRSGLIVPSFFFSSSRGVVFQKLGYYWATSDYFDTQLTSDITTKGGYTLSNLSRYKIIDQLDGSLSLAYGDTRFSPAESFLKNWSLIWNHKQQFDPQTSLSANVNFSSQDFNRNTSTDLSQRLIQNVSSVASFNEQFDNGNSLTVNYRRTQNIINGDYNETLPEISMGLWGTSLIAAYNRTTSNGSITEEKPTLSYRINQIFPFRFIAKEGSLLGDLSFSDNISFLNQSKYIPADTVSSRPVFSDVSKRISHTPSINISPKLGYFTISPQISYSENYFFRKISSKRNAIDTLKNHVIGSQGQDSVYTTYDSNRVVNSYENGFFHDYSYNYGVSIGTKLYGIFQPNFLGIKAFRHTFRPSLSYTYTPDFSSNSFGFNSQYTDIRNGRPVAYSVFESDGGYVRGGLSSSLGLSLANSFDAKISDNDTATKAINLFNLDFSGNYNFAADSLKMSDISAYFRTSLGAFSINGSFSATPYVQETVLDTVLNGEPKYKNITADRYLFSEGRGLARLKTVSFSLSTSLSAGSFGVGNPVNPAEALKKDTVNYGDRFSQRMDTTAIQRDVFGENHQGFLPLGIPWNLSLNISFGYSRLHPALLIDRTFNMGSSFDFQLTPTWKVRTSFSYDFVSNLMNVPAVDITKDLADCWDMNVTWNPSGYFRGFYLRIGIKAAQLKDIKLEKRDNAIYN